MFNVYFDFGHGAATTVPTFIPACICPWPMLVPFGHCPPVTLSRLPAWPDPDHKVALTLLSLALGRSTAIDMLHQVRQAHFRQDPADGAVLD